MLKYLQIFLLSLAIFSCETNPPTYLIEDDELGKVYVSSNIIAEILVNGISIGKMTPDTLELFVGQYDITLQKEGYFSTKEEIEVEKNSYQEITMTLTEQIVQKVVLIEDFSNVSCPPCVASNNTLRSLKSSYTSEKLVIVKFPANFPSPQDPMYLASKEDADSRLSYYTIFSTPTIIVDGINKTVATDSMSIKSIIDASLLKIPPFSIEVEESITGQTMYVSGKVKLLDNSGIDFDGLVLHTVIIESRIEYSSPPGSNGETEFDDVLRKMLPSNAGFSISNIESEGEINFSFESIINSAWNKDRLEIIVYVQHSNSKEVYQANSTTQ